MKQKLPNIEDQSMWMGAAAVAGVCLLIVNGAGEGSQAGLRQVARQSRWLVLDVDLIDAKDGPWVGAAMPGAANGCGIFAGAEPGAYVARSDDKGVYLSATLDQLLRANGIRCLCLIGDAPEAFADSLRNFAIAHGYVLRTDPPGESSDVAFDSVRPLVRDFESRVAPENAALLLIDFQNDFCAPDGAAGRTGAGVRMVDAAVRRARLLLKSARERGIFVVHVRAEYGRPWRSTSSPYRFPVEGRREPAVWTASASEASTNRGFEDDETEVCRTGTWGAEFVEGLGPQPGEAVITKHRFGAFAGTGLDQLLRARCVSNLIIAGVTTNCCVETAAREAVMREFNLIVVEDCVGVKDHLEDLHRASLEAIGTYFGLVRPAADIIAAWNARAVDAGRLQR